MKVLIFDTETTSLSRNSAMRLEKQPHITEFYGLTLDAELNEIGHWGSLFNYMKPLEEKNVKITGITNSMLVDAPLFRTKADELKAFIESHDRVVGHNLTFDMERIDNEMERCGRKVEWPKSRICTVECSEWIKGYRLSLQALHTELFGAEFANAHRAENDVRATAKCYIELVKRGDV